MNQNMDPNQMNNTQTQVLNLNDVEQAAKQEKKDSRPKKFAIIILILGVLAIAGGLSYNSITSMLGINPAEDASRPVDEVDVTENEDTTMEASTEEPSLTTTCTLAQPSQPNGVDKTTSIELTFDESNQLQSFVKTLNMTPTTGNSTGPVTVTTYKNGYTTIAGYQIPGYTVQVTPTNDGEVAGLQAVVTVDLSTFDKTKYDTYNITDEFAKVDLALNEQKDTVTQALTTKGYTCQ